MLGNVPAFMALRKHRILPDQMSLPHVLVERFGTHALRQRCPSLHGLKLGQIRAICARPNAARMKRLIVRADVFPSFVRPKPTGRIFQNVIFQHAQTSVENTSPSFNALASVVTNSRTPRRNAKARPSPDARQKPPPCRTDVTTAPNRKNRRLCAQKVHQHLVGSADFGQNP